MTLGKFAALCAMPGMPTPQTLRAWISRRDDFPVAVGAPRSRDWLFDLDEAAAFVLAHYRDGRGLHRFRMREIAPAEHQYPLFFKGDA